MGVLKQGLEYFPLSTDFFNTDKVQLISARHGLKGESIILRLLCKIYANGYFYRLGNDEFILFVKRLGDHCTHSFVEEIVRDAVLRGFFDQNLYDKFRILTSESIQRRYFEATSRRKRVEIYEEYLLIDYPKAKNVIIVSPNVNIGMENDSNGEQKKRKERKRNERESEQVPSNALAQPLTYDVQLPMTDYGRFLDWLNENAPYCSNANNFDHHIAEAEFYTLKEKYTGTELAHVIELIENRKDLRRRYTNLYKTIINWAKKEYGN